MRRLRLAAGVAVFVMPCGPIIMLLGAVVGGFLGFALAMANDTCRVRRKSSAAEKQKAGF